MAFLRLQSRRGHPLVPGSGAARSEMRDGALGDRAGQRAAHQLPARAAAGGGAGLEGIALAQQTREQGVAGRAGVDRGAGQALRESAAGRPQAARSRRTRMRCAKFGRQYPDDPDVGVLFAEAMMDLRPWDQWTPEGKPQPGHGGNPRDARRGAETESEPSVREPSLHSRGRSFAESRARGRGGGPACANLQPGLAHNVHMPSHIDIRRGRWQQAIDQNVKAVAADRRYRKIVGPPTGCSRSMPRTTTTCWPMPR